MTNKKSSRRTKTTGEPVDIIEAAEKEALEKAKEKAEKLTDLIVESVSPPGTRMPKKKK